MRGCNENHTESRYSQKRKCYIKKISIIEWIYNKRNKKMKHVKLFENFDRVNESDSESDLVFDWIPFDSQVNNPANSRMPEQLNFSDLVSLRASGNNESKDLGLYIAHKKLGDGFIRLISGYDDPMNLIVAKFDSEFKKVKEDVVNAEKLNLSSYLRGSAIASRFGI